MGRDRKRRPASDDADGGKGRLFLKDSIEEEGVPRIGRTDQSHLIYAFRPLEAPHTFIFNDSIRQESYFQEGEWESPNHTTIDHYALQPETKMVVVFDPEKNDIVGGFNYSPLNKAHRTNEGDLDLETGKLFSYSDKFMDEYARDTAEITKMFTNPTYRRTPEEAVSAKKDMWAALASLPAIEGQDIHYLASFLLYPDSQPKSRQLLYGFLQREFPANGESDLLHAKLQAEWDEDGLTDLIKGYGRRGDKQRAIEKTLEETYGEKVPPLFGPLVELSDETKIFGPSVNKDFGETTSINYAQGDLIRPVSGASTNLKGAVKPLESEVDKEYHHATGREETPVKPVEETVFLIPAGTMRKDALDQFYSYRA